MLIPKEYIENIITIVEWNLKEYHSPELPKDDFVIRWEKIVDLLTSKNLEVIDDKFLYYLIMVVVSSCGTALVLTITILLQKLFDNRKQNKKEVLSEQNA